MEPVNAPLSAAGLVLDAIFVAGIAWMLVRRLAPELERALELALAWGIAALATIAGAGVVLGEIGGLHLPGFLTLHAALLAGLAVGRRPRLAAVVTSYYFYSHADVILGRLMAAWRHAFGMARVAVRELVGRATGWPGPDSELRDALREIAEGKIGLEMLKKVPL